MGNRWAVLAFVTVARTAMGFQFQSVAAVGPFLVADLGLSYAELGTLIGLYLMPGAFLALPGGLLGARFGDRKFGARVDRKSTVRTYSTEIGDDRCLPRWLAE